MNVDWKYHNYHQSRVQITAVNLARLPAAQQQDLVGVAQLLLLELDVLVNLLVDAEAVRPPRHALPVRHVGVPGLEAGDGAVADGAHHHLHLLARHTQARPRALILTTEWVNMLQPIPNWRIRFLFRVPFNENLILKWFSDNVANYLPLFVTR